MARFDFDFSVDRALLERSGAPFDAFGLAATTGGAYWSADAAAMDFFGTTAAALGDPVAWLDDAAGGPALIQFGPARPIRQQVIGLDGSFDYVIDAAFGLDSNDGQTSASAWSSLNKIATIVGTAGATTRVLVRSGLYDKPADFIEVTAFATGARLEIVFEPGCIMDGTAISATASQSPVYAGNGGAWTMSIYGNGLLIRHYNNGTAGSPNGLGYGGSGVTLEARNVVIDDTYDGISGHEAGHGVFYDVVVRGSRKTAVANVSGATMDAIRCRFEEDGGESGGFFNSDTGRQYFEDCVFLPNGPGYIRGDHQEFVRCQLGTTLARVRPERDNATISVLIRDCFINVFDLGLSGAVYTTCYGKLTVRFRETGGTTVDRCVIVGPATGETRVFTSNYNPSAGAPYLFRDTVFAGNFTFDGGFTGAKVPLLAETELSHNLLFGGVAYSSNMQSGATVTDTLAEDPLIGAANSYNPESYAVGAGSPALGAGSDGGDIGFASEAVAPRIPAPSTGLVLRFDGVGDMLQAILPAGLSGEVIVAGRGGILRIPDVSLASAGALDVGPTDVAGSIDAVFSAGNTGGGVLDLIAVVAVGRALSAAEWQGFVSHFETRGAGPEI